MRDWNDLKRVHLKFWVEGGLFDLCFALKEHLPIIFGVLTTNTEEQAWERAGGKDGHAGERAADAAAEMIAVMASIHSPAKV